MHIVIDARIINSSTGTYVRELLNHLQLLDTKTRYTVLVPSKDVSYWRPTASNFSIKAADFPSYSFREQFGFGSFLTKLKPDLVHFCMPQQPIFYSGARVTTVHDMTLLNTYNSDKNWFVFHAKQLVGRWVWKQLPRLNQHIITVSKNTYREFTDFVHIQPDKISVIYEAAHTVPVKKLMPYHALPYRDFILYVGQQPDYKNIRRLGDAHQQLLARHPDLGLVLVGRITEPVLRNKRYFESKGYQNIHFTDYLPDEQRDWLYTKTKAYVFPSLMEGFGLPPLEAMACGTPVISSNTSCMPEILGSAAEYFNPFDTTTMASAIERVITNPDLCKTMVKRGYEQAARYSWQNTAKQTLAVYKQALGKNW
ncbi:MAG: glycosyltransferase family 1 protein [Candidatus Saccharimonas sp.]